MSKLYDSKDKGKGMSAGKHPGKAGTPGKEFPLESKGPFGAKKTGSGKLPLGGGKQPKSPKGK